MEGRYISSHFIDDINVIDVIDVQFLGQRGDSGGGEAVGAAEVAGHHIPGEDVDLPF